jgi:hypothetical protein
MKKKTAIWVTALLVASACAALIIPRLYKRRRLIVGVTLVQDTDPRRQAPIPGVEIAAAVGDRVVHGRSDAGGAFRLTIPTERWRSEDVELQFRHPGYQPLKIMQPLHDEIYVARMTAMSPKSNVGSSISQTTLKDVRVRYATKMTSPLNVGSVARTFEVVNTGDVSCGQAPVCSPDRRWRAATGGLTLDAGDSHEFQTVRISCIAGPCAFTRIESNQSLRGGQVIKVSVRAWSDTVTFLVEAEVVQNTFADSIRNAYPAIFGREMSFTLPPTTQGPSIEAETNGTDIVYPLGPELSLSWAVCSLEIGPDRTKLYHCELKPGYAFH